MPSDWQALTNLVESNKDLIMELTRKSLKFALAILCCIGLVGCENGGADNKKPANSSGASHDHAHDNGEHGHSHDGHSHDKDAHDHGTAGHSHAAGPHGGTVVDWGGGKYHVEFVVDHEKKQATAYIFGTDEKTPAPISSENVELSIKEPAFQVTLMPQSQETDPAGQSSRFVGTHESLGEKREYSGTLTAMVNSTPYSGDFKE
jgi:hypothetical protein